MRVSADQWISGPEALVLIEAPAKDRQEALRKRLRLAYEAGYKDGRISNPSRRRSGEQGL